METTANNFSEKDISEMIKMKKQDKQLQITMFILSVVLIPFTLFFSIFLMGLTHAGSTFHWLSTNRHLPRTQGRTIIERLNIITLVLLALTALSSVSIGDVAFAYAIVGISCVGPVLGLSYFLVTVYEIRFYEHLLQYERA